MCEFLEWVRSHVVCVWGCSCIQSLEAAASEAHADHRSAHVQSTCLVCKLELLEHPTTVAFRRLRNTKWRNLANDDKTDSKSNETASIVTSTYFLTQSKSNEKSNA